MRALHPTGPVYTFWDYQAGAWQRDMGLRIDHALLAPRLAEPWSPQPGPRGAREDQPSDHVPVVIDLDWARPAEARPAEAAPEEA